MIVEMRRLFARAAAAGMLAVVLLVPSGPARGSRVADVLATPKASDTELSSLLKSIPFEKLLMQLSHLSSTAESSISWVC